MGHLRTFQLGQHAALSQRLLNEVAAARLCLLNPHKKREYDEQLRQEAGRQNGRHDAAPPPAPPPVGRREHPL